jgi:hypothetical protein
MIAGDVQVKLGAGCLLISLAIAPVQFALVVAYVHLSSNAANATDSISS